MTHCYCEIEYPQADMLVCAKCKKFYHTECLKTQLFHSPVIGDIYFYLECIDCSSTEQEIFYRPKPLKWVQAVLLALYNIHMAGKSSCHWKRQILKFINSNWLSLFGVKKAKEQKCTNIITGTLHKFSGTLFISDGDGRWHLTENEIPSFAQLDAITKPKMTQKNKTQLKRPNLSKPQDSFSNYKKQVLSDDVDSSSSESSSPSDIEEEVMDTVEEVAGTKLQVRDMFYDDEVDSVSYEDFIQQSDEYMNQISPPPTKNDFCKFEVETEEEMHQMEEILKKREKEYDATYAHTKSQTTNITFQELQDLSKHIALNKAKPFVSPLIDLTEDSFENPIVVKEDTPNSDFKETKSKPLELARHTSIALDANKSIVYLTAKLLQDNIPESVSPMPKETCDNIVECIKDQKCTLASNQNSDTVHVFIAEAVEIPKNNKLVIKPKINNFTKEIKDIPNTITKLTERQDKELLEKLNTYLEINKSDLKLVHLRAKLMLRQEKRRLNLPIFNIDELVNCKNVDLTNKLSSSGDPKVYFYCSLECSQTNCLTNDSIRLIERITGYPYASQITSEFSTRTLNLKLFEDYNVRPKKLKLLNAILSYGQKYNLLEELPTQYPISYSYLTINNIDAVHEILFHEFWSGIDVSLALKAPEFTVIALYRKIVIGFLIATLDSDSNIYLSFLYTHPDWREAGIASRMLFQLILESKGREITLHVSRTNLCVSIYRKFGFQKERIYKDFYSQHFKVDAKDSVDAYFMRYKGLKS